MLTQQDISNYFNKILGRQKYVVYLGAMPIVNDDDRIPVVLSIGQTPMTVMGTSVVQNNVTLLFDVPLAGGMDTEMTAAKSVILHVSSLFVGIKDHVIKDASGKAYKVTTDFSISELSAARKDTGMIRANFTVSGSLLISDGELLFGRIRFSLDGTPLLLTSYGAHLEKGTRRDMDVSEGTDDYRLTELNRANTFALNVLYRGTSIERELIKQIDGDRNTALPLNRTYTLSADYGDFVTEKTVKFVSGDISGQQGAFLSFTVNFERVDI